MGARTCQAGMEYFDARERLPWYSSVRLYRQASLGEWQPVVAQVSTELQRLPADRHCLD